MRVSVEILDLIFGFLIPHREALIACSKDQVLSPIVKRHLFYHVIVHLGSRYEKADSMYAFEPDCLSNLLSEDPRILNHIRILQIRFQDDPLLCMRKIKLELDTFAETLIKFPVLECMILTSRRNSDWCFLSEAFRDALENRLSLPTAMEVHFASEIVLDLNCKNDLVLSGYLGASAPGQFQSLQQFIPLDPITRLKPYPLHYWAKSHIKELRSLRCVAPLAGGLSELLEVCSGTLNILDIGFERKV